MTHGFKKCLLDVVQLLTIKKENKAKIVWKALSFLLTLVVNTHIPHIYIHTHTQWGVFYPSPFQIQRFPNGYERSFEKNPTILKFTASFLAAKFQLPIESLCKENGLLSPQVLPFSTKAASHQAFHMVAAGLKLKGKDTSYYQSRESTRNRKHKQSKVKTVRPTQSDSQQVLAFVTESISVDFNKPNSK